MSLNKRRESRLQPTESLKLDLDPGLLRAEGKERCLGQGDPVGGKALRSFLLSQSRKVSNSNVVGVSADALGPVTRRLKMSCLRILFAASVGLIALFSSPQTRAPIRVRTAGRMSYI